MFPYNQTVHFPKHLSLLSISFPHSEKNCTHHSRRGLPVMYSGILLFPSLLSIPWAGIIFSWPYHLDSSVCLWSDLVVPAFSWKALTSPNSSEPSGGKPYTLNPTPFGGLRSSSAHSPSTAALWLSPVPPNLRHQQIPLLHQHWKEEHLEGAFKRVQPQDLF